MASNPNNKLRRNVQKFADMDYVKSLSEDEQEFMRKFVDEYYCGGHTKENSLHRQAYGDQYESNLDGKASIKQEMYLDMNAQNRDITGIAGCSNNMICLEDVLEDLMNESCPSLDKQLSIKTPEIILKEITQECSDEIHSEPKDSTENLLIDYALKVIKLYMILKKESTKKKPSKSLVAEKPKKQTDVLSAIDRDSIQKRLDQIKSLSSGLK